MIIIIKLKTERANIANQKTEKTIIKKIKE